jgi:hypothetical protein
LAKSSGDFRTWGTRLSVSHRKFEPIEREIKRNLQYYRGDQWSMEARGRYTDHPVENMIYANLRAILPRLNFRNPKIFVTPNKKPFRRGEVLFDTISASAIVEILINAMYRNLGTKRETRKCIIDAYLAKYAVMELGYTLETEKVASNDELIETNELIVGDSPFAVRRSPLDLRVDSEATDTLLHDADWIALRWIKTLKDVKRNPRYSNTRNLQANHRVKTHFDPSKPEANDDFDRREMMSQDPEVWGRVEGWDIWDKKKHKLRTLVEGHNKFLQEIDWPLDIEGFPVEILYFNENPNEFYPISDVDTYINNQDELNRLRSCQLSHVRRISERKYTALENSMDADEMRKITHGGDGTVATIKQKDGLQPLKDATISQDIYIIANLMKASIREMAGITDMEALASTKFEQATEPALIERSAATVREDQRSIFEDFVKRITKKLFVIVQQTMGTDESIPLNNETFTEARQFVPQKLEKMVGPGGEAILPWLNLSREDIEGDYDFSIEIGSTQPINQETRKRDATQLYGALADNPWIKTREGTKLFLEAFKDFIRDPEALLKTEEEFAREQQASEEAAQAAELAPFQLKAQTDLTKTQMKVAAQREGTAAKAAAEGARNETERGKTQANFLGSMLSKKGREE